MARKIVTPLDLSAVPTGTAPLIVASTTVVPNLNVALFNGQAASYYVDIPARLGYTPVNRAGDTMTGTLVVTRGGSDSEAIRLGNSTDGKRLHLVGRTAGAEMRSENSDLIMDAADGGTVMRLRTQGADRVVVNGTGAAVTGALTTTGSVTANQNFVSSTTIALLAATGGAGAVYLRPDGAGSSTGQLLVSNSDMTRGGNTVWDSGNDGSGSGLDADVLDGVQGNFFVQGSTANRTSSFPSDNANTAAPSGFYEVTPDGTGAPTASWYWMMHARHSNVGNVYAFQLAQAIGENRTYVRNINNGTPGSWSEIALLNATNVFTARTQVSSTFRSTGVSDFSAGAGLEFYYDPSEDGGNGAGLIVGLNRTGIVWKDIYIYGKTVNFLNSGASILQILSNGELTRKNDNSGTMTRIPRIFVQSGDPGAAAEDGDLWFW